jgi:hypothetical protein
MSIVPEGSISQFVRSASRQGSLQPNVQQAESMNHGEEPTEPKWISDKGSQRWMYFQSALRLAIQRVSNKWT